jgi:hypothetical protein
MRWREIPLVPRVSLVGLLVSNLVVGVWAQVAPQSFYRSFPGFGRVWVAVDGPYNQHLVRDVGGLNLGIAFVIAMALVSASPLVVRAAGGASLIYGLPHLMYHATHLSPFGTGDAVALVVSLSLAVLAAAAALEARFPAGEVTYGRTAPPPG